MENHYATRFRKHIALLIINDDRVLRRLAAISPDVYDRIGGEYLLF